MKYFILGSIITLLISVCVILYIQNTSLSASINTYRNDKEFVNKEFQKVKEDYYIEQQNRDTNLILFTVTCLFAIFATITVIGVKSEFKSQIEVVNNKYDEQISEYQKSVVHINNLKSGFSFQHANNLHKDFKDLLLKNTLDASSLVELGIVVCEHYCYAIGYNSNNHVKFDESVHIIISSVINKMLVNSENYDEIKLISMDYNRFINAKKVIEKIVNIEDSKRLYKIYSKLSFPTLN